MSNNGNQSNNGGLNRWANQYGSGYINDNADCRGDGTCPLSGGNGSGQSNAYNNAGAGGYRNHRFGNSNGRNNGNNNGGLNRWGNQYGSGYINDAKDSRGESPRARRWQQAMRNAGMGQGVNAASAAARASQGYNTGANAGQSNGRYSNSNARYNNSNGRYSNSNARYNNSNARSPRYNNSNAYNGGANTGFANTGFSNVGANTGANNGGANTRFNNNGGANTGFNNGGASPRSRSQSQGGQGAERWRSLLEECGNETDLNGVECAVYLDDLYEGPFERPNSGQFRDAVLESAQSKLAAAGQDNWVPASLQGANAGSNFAGSNARGSRNNAGVNSAATRNNAGANIARNNAGANAGSKAGANANFMNVTQDIDRRAQEIVQQISGGDQLASLEEYTTAVRELAGSRVAGQGVNAVQATKALDKYYQGSTENGRGRSNSRGANGRSKSRSKSPSKGSKKL